MTTNQIKNAYLNVFGDEPAPSEIIEIKENEDFYGNNSQDLAEQLIKSPRFLNQPKTDDNIERTFQVFFGSKPTEKELEEIKGNNDYWGENLGNVAEGLRRTPRWNSDNPLNIRPIVDDQGGKAIESPSNTSPKQEIEEENMRTPKTKEHTKKIEEDLKSLGLTDNEISVLDDNTKEFIGTISEEINNVENTEPLPTTFTPDVLEQMYEKAINDPKIQKYYQRMENRYVEQVLTSVAEAQEDLSFSTRRKMRDFKRQKEDLSAKAEKQGILYSGVRDEAKEDLQEEQSDVITSKVRQARSQLQEVGKQAEQTLGTKKVKDLDLALSVPEIQGIDSKEVSNMVNRGEITFDEYSEAIRPEESDIGRQKFEETKQEYQRLINQTDILANPDNVTR